MGVLYFTFCRHYAPSAAWLYKSRFCLWKQTFTLSPLHSASTRFCLQLPGHEQRPSWRYNIGKTTTDWEGGREEGLRNSPNAQYFIFFPPPSVSDFQNDALLFPYGSRY